uniref:Uncharacterized protein n=1 Tax=Noctiluca scintillans TaxID=2966 RepID=A0A6T9E1A4_NOCSC
MKCSNSCRFTPPQESADETSSTPVTALKDSFILLKMASSIVFSGLVGAVPSLEENVSRAGITNACGTTCVVTKHASVARLSELHDGRLHLAQDSFIHCL